MASRKELLDSIHEGMTLDRSFFLKVYGYEITSHGFADKAIKILEDCGCSKAREYYNTTVEEYQDKRRKELKEVACYISKKWEEEWKKIEERSEALRKQELKKELRKDLKNLTERELTELYKTLMMKCVITSPEQFQMVLEGLDL